MQPYDSPVRDIAAIEELHEGCTYLVEERRPRHSLEICEKMISDGGSLLLVSRDPPSKILEGTILSPKSAIWLTNMPGDGRIDPTSIGILMTEIRKFVEREDQFRPVVLMDGMEYLMSINTYDRMLQFIHQLRDIFVMAKAILLLPMDTRTLTERELALLERNLEVIVPVCNATVDSEHAEGHIFNLPSDGIGT